MKPTNDCSCEKCVKACTQTPGWFLPGEAELVAQYLNIEFDVFAKQYLIKDAASNPYVEDAPWIWTPRKASDKPEDEERTYYSQREQADCVFLVAGKCSIHEVKPFECASVRSCEKVDRGMRNDIEDKWMAAGAPLGERIPTPGSPFMAILGGLF